MARDIQFDAQCDLAALVYDAPNKADRLLREFVQNLTGNGYRVIGLIQTRLGEGGTAVTVLPTAETISLAPAKAPPQARRSTRLATWRRRPRASTA
jgi:Protein of unknown function (DUF2478)